MSILVNSNEHDEIAKAARKRKRVGGDMATAREQSIDKAAGDELKSTRGGVGRSYRAPTVPANTAKIAQIRGKLAPLKAAAVLATKK